MKLTRVTITGGDESVRPSDLLKLSNEFPFVEWGILLSKKRQGQEPRYPSHKWIESVCGMSVMPKLSGHLCGEWSVDAVTGPFIWAIQHRTQFGRFGRVQLNGALCETPTLARVRYLKHHFPEKEFILQVKSFTGGGYCHDVGPVAPSLLLDNSGGRGIELQSYPPPVPGAKCGYSGGIGPNIIRSVLENLTAIPADQEFWIDMESNVRSDVGGKSVLDLDEVRCCLGIAAKFVNGTC